MNIEIRKATKNDIKELTSLFDEFDKYNAQKTNTKFIKDPKNSEYSEYDLVHSKREIYLAFIDGKPVGYLTFYFLEISNEVYIEDLFLIEKARNLGLGKKFMEIPFNLAKELKANVKLEVYKWNGDAIKFYENIGFEEDSIVFIKKFE